MKELLQIAIVVYMILAVALYQTAKKNPIFQDPRLQTVPGLILVVLVFVFWPISAFWGGVIDKWAENRDGE